MYSLIFIGKYVTVTRKQVENKYFIQQYSQQEYQHGGIGCVDAERIIGAKGFKPICFPHHTNFSIGAKVSRFLFLIKMFFAVGKGAIVIFLFPVYAKMNRLLLNLLLRKKGVRFICFVADIDGIKDGNKELLTKEIKFFRQFSHFIVHNEKMKEWLQQNVSTGSVAAGIEFFDFLTIPANHRKDISFDIAFAGNLEKSRFLEQLYLLDKNSTSLHFHLYGPGQTEAMVAQRNVTYHGVEKPYDLPPKLTGSFGLLWDGDAIDKPGGSLGHYMQYISHHKLSLYILGGLPIIAPATAASAPMIEKYKIGFAVSNLYEIEDKIKNLSPAEYRQMQTNMIPLAEKISKGECIGNALNELLKQL